MRSLVQVQDGPPENQVKSQKLKVKSCEAFERRLESFELIRGGIAQLVERLLCKQDVSGSNPLTSTKNNEEKKEKNSASS